MEWILIVPILLFSIVVHEVAHAWVARREGDDTAERQGRITLNPLRHLDPVGSVLVPGILIALQSGFLFGWARPVPVNPANFRDPVGGDIRVSLAGPASNFLLALVFTALLVPAVALGGDGGFAGDPLGASPWVAGAVYGILINLILAIFNLIPIPPLDGSHVVRHLLPRGVLPAYEAVGKFGILALLAFLFVVPGGFQVIMVPVRFLAGLLTGVAGLAAG